MRKDYVFFKYHLNCAFQEIRFFYKDFVFNDRLPVKVLTPKFELKKSPAKITLLQETKDNLPNIWLSPQRILTCFTLVFELQRFIKTNISSSKCASIIILPLTSALIFSMFRIFVSTKTNHYNAWKKNSSILKWLRHLLKMFSEECVSCKNINPSLLTLFLKYSNILVLLFLLMILAH